ncbi:BatD family protein [Shewanella sp. D64]|uniref:BatD family protein n=1 Tax=unclassified Shewanella TaxID=196818 RepID=UPI0022BA6F0B|nr:MULTISPECIES: BatD family protein [unclassified Shewanella]MEC4728905.1 BatD family protein [Shewanella sp. D64]MEC4740779.1 BatD family protein [Shewanella sp. E94]WBJ97385.1 BatD family protein [Shewanella sp. MTB7]
MLIRQLFLLALITLSTSFPSFALTSIEASVDRNPAVEGQYLVLTIEADDDVSTGKLDTSALLKDFIVGRTSVSRNTQIINFDASRKTTWQVLLAPLHAGNVQIPALTIDGVSSAPISLAVVTANSQPEQMESLFIRGTLSTDEAYVGQMITYKVKLYLAVDLQRGVLSAPTPDGAQIKQLGEDIDKTEIVNGKRYRVIERTYSIIADQPGELTIDGAGFSGDVLVQSSRRGGMFSFNESKPMQAKAPKEIILINPIPNEFHGEWLVSDLVALNEDWPTEPQEYEVGTPITRTINLLASNTDETSLPELTIQLPPELKSYPEKSLRKTFLRDKQMVSQLTQTLAIVPTKAGIYTLPEIRVPWWNPFTKQQELASLPARTIKVISNQNIASELPVLDFETQTSSTNGFWPWLTLLFATLWIITVILWRKALTRPSIGKPNVNDTSTPNVAKPTDSALQQFEVACHEKEVGKVLSTLQIYFSETYKQTMTLNEIAALSETLNTAINELQISAFSRSKTELDYALILSAVKSTPHPRAQKNHSPLAKLNPS